VQIVHYQTDNVLIDNCFFDSNWSATACHGEQLTAGNNANDWIIRNSFFYNSLTGAIALHNGGMYSERWKIYNNIFVGGYVTMGVVGCADSASYHSDILRLFETYNNTIVNVKGAGYGGGFYNSCYQTSKAFNNLFYNVSHPIIGNYSNYNTVIHDYNGFFNCTGIIPEEKNGIISNNDPFEDISRGNYRLKADSLAKDAGISLNDEFAIDRSGIIRPQGSGWDIGAYEYVKPLSLSPPSGLRIIAE